MDDQIALSELSVGLHIHSTTTDQFLADKALNSPNPWVVLGAILTRAQRGEFSELSRIEYLLRSNSEQTFWHAAVQIHSLASSWESSLRLMRSLEDLRHNPTTQLYIAVMLGNTCDLRAVEPLLDLHNQSDTDDVRYEIERTLSHLLEANNGPIWWGADEEEVELDQPDENGSMRADVVDKEGYASAVRTVRDTLKNSLNTESVFGAEAFDVKNLASSLDHRIKALEPQRDRIHHERIILEASTGIDCSSFDDQSGNLVQLTAAALLADIRDSDLSAYQPQQRYFFGYPVFN